MPAFSITKYTDLELFSKNCGICWSFNFPMHSTVVHKTISMHMMPILASLFYPLSNAYEYVATCNCINGVQYGKGLDGIKNSCLLIYYERYKQNF